MLRDSGLNQTLTSPPSLWSAERHSKAATEPWVSSRFSPKSKLFISYGKFGYGKIQKRKVYILDKKGKLKTIFAPA
jgi:hypothetical protein